MIHYASCINDGLQTNDPFAYPMGPERVLDAQQVVKRLAAFRANGQMLKLDIRQLDQPIGFETVLSPLAC